MTHLTINKHKCVSDAEDFFSSVIEVVESLRKDFIMIANRTFNHFKRELAINHSQISSILETLKSIKQIPLKMPTEKEAIEFLRK